MKKIIAAVSSLGMALSFSLAIPAPAMANNGAKNIVDYCKAVTAGSEYSTGDCVSYFRNNDVVQFCKFIGLVIGYPNATWNNQGDCISDIRPL